MRDPISGIHHITAIAGDPQRNVDFYAGFLGLRLVKKTVNFDDPGTYHLYFGDELGHPGTILTFFPWPGAYRGRRGTGEAAVVSFSVPERSLDFWIRRGREHGLTLDGPQTRLSGELFLTLFDPDGLQLELIGNASRSGGWEDSPVPPEHGIQGFHGATLALGRYEPTAELLTGSFGFRLVEEREDRIRFGAPGSGPGAFVDILRQPDSLRRGMLGAGTDHHIAWRTADDKTQEAWRRHLTELDYHVTPVMDRQYFSSIYFREPGGVLFEIATDPPGFTLDESPDRLGTALKLPKWLEPRRPELERTLPQLEIPANARIHSSLHSC